MMLWQRVSLLLALFVVRIGALHFYLDAGEKRCFIEELPTDTIVEGMSSNAVISVLIEGFFLGHYRALQWDDKTQKYEANSDLGIQVNVEVRYWTAHLSLLDLSSTGH